MRIVDAHHHLWDLSACNYPWLMAKGVKRFFGDPAPIQKNYLVADFRRDAVEFELAGSVHVQVGVAEGDELKESAWLQKTANSEGLPSAIVAYCDLRRDDLDAQLAAQVRYRCVRGARQIIGRSSEEDALTGSGRLLDDPLWKKGLWNLREYGLSFDLQLIPAQMQRAAEVFAEVDEINVALCHCGSPWDQTREGVRRWRRGLKQLAELPNMFCKLSGLGMFDHDWTTESITPLIESCIEIFGAERCMFGSNFPVDKLHASYSTVWRAFDAITSGMRDSERQRLFAGTATEFYRLEEAC